MILCLSGRAGGRAPSLHTAGVSLEIRTAALPLPVPEARRLRQRAALGGATPLARRGVDHRHRLLNVVGTGHGAALRRRWRGGASGGRGGGGGRAPAARQAAHRLDAHKRRRRAQESRGASAQRKAGTEGKHGDGGTASEDRCADGGRSKNAKCETCYSPKVLCSAPRASCTTTDNSSRRGEHKLYTKHTQDTVPGPTPAADRTPYVP